jgi:hypothetical protein
LQGEYIYLWKFAQRVLKNISLFLLAPVSHPIPTLFPIGLVKVSALDDWFLYLKPITRTGLTHRPDDGGSKDL